MKPNIDIAKVVGARLRTTDKPGEPRRIAAWAPPTFAAVVRLRWSWLGVSPDIGRRWPSAGKAGVGPTCKYLCAKPAILHPRQKHVHPQERTHVRRTGFREAIEDVSFHFRPAAFWQHAAGGDPEAESAVPCGHDQSHRRHHGRRRRGNEQQERFLARDLRRGAGLGHARAGRELLRRAKRSRGGVRYQSAVV